MSRRSARFLAAALAGSFASAGVAAFAASEAPGPAGSPSAGEAPAPLPAISGKGLRVTLGRLQERGDELLVDSGKFRAVARQATARLAELDFTYLGPTTEKAPLASGELRRQLGLKLRARDGCNLVYVMWRIEPRPELVVSVKYNPGASEWSDCGPRGYRNVKPERAGPLERLEPGRRYRLRAELQGERLVVRVDGEPVWEGRLGREVLGFDGPVGLRTDNARVRFVLRAR